MTSWKPCTLCTVNWFMMGVSRCMTGSALQGHVAVCCMGLQCCPIHCQHGLNSEDCYPQACHGREWVKTFFNLQIVTGKCMLIFTYQANPSPKRPHVFVVSVQLEKLRKPCPQDLLGCEKARAETIATFVFISAIKRANKCTQSKPCSQL